MELLCDVQHYEWGVKGSRSLVAKFAQNNSNHEIVEDMPYAEFWMGTHPNGPSIVKASKTPLSLHVQKNSFELGASVVEYFGEQLPFLFKVLSVNKALSVQTHPSKSEAEYLHNRFPDIYKDSNHKPEMAIALTEFKALCSFRPQEEIKFYLKTIPEFGQMIEKEKMEAFLDCDECNSKISTDKMKDCFQTLMLCPDYTVKLAADDLITRLKQSTEDVKNQYSFDLVLKLSEEFPGDIGIFCIYWLNYIVLKPGEAIYLAPNEPHAYLSGDCIECMANSDNVIRAGLTPKFRDVPMLCQLLSYKSYSPSEILFQPVRENEFSLLFSPPIRDFAMAQIIVPVKKEYSLPKRFSASIIIIVQGRGVTKSGIPLKPGSVIYAPSGEEFHLKSEETITIYQAFCNTYLDTRT